MTAATRLGTAASDGFAYYPGYLGGAQAAALAEAVADILAAAPAYVPHMPRSGKPLSVRMTNCGPLGWYTDKAGGYRYIDRHPATGRPWPPMPHAVLDIWHDIADYPAPPEACLVNLYGPTGKVGQHVDQDEDAPDAPVVSISLGDTAIFRLGGAERGSPTRTLRLASGDVVVLGGAARHWYHGVDRILPGTSTLLPGGGRINLTMRRVTRP